MSDLMIDDHRQAALQVLDAANQRQNVADQGRKKAGIRGNRAQKSNDSGGLS